MKGNEDFKKILARLPGYNCGGCGYPRCEIFAQKLIHREVNLELCLFMAQEQFYKNREIIENLLIPPYPPLAKGGSGDFLPFPEEPPLPQSSPQQGEEVIKGKIIGLIDKAGADFLLEPFPGEISCRETLFIYDYEIHLRKGDEFTYRPLGCPLPHFAKVIESEHEIPIVHVIGPLGFLNNQKDFLDVGLARVIGFEGIVNKGRIPEVGQSVRFLPSFCMMGKVHTGVVVNAINNKVYLENISLKVWEEAKVTVAA